MSIDEIRAGLMRRIDGEVTFEKRDQRFNEEAGWYDPPIPTTNGRVLIGRIVLCADVEPHATIVLAHEIGHHRSQQQGKRTAAYEAACSRVNREGSWAVLNESEQASVLAEENHAWDFAREELIAVGFTDWTNFDEARLRGIAFQISRFGTPPASPQPHGDSESGEAAGGGGATTQGSTD